MATQTQTLTSNSLGQVSITLNDSVEYTVVAIEYLSEARLGDRISARSFPAREQVRAWAQARRWASQLAERESARVARPDCVETRSDDRYTVPA